MYEGLLREDRLTGPLSALLVIMLALGVLLRFYEPDTQSFWLDELWTAVASDPELSLSQWMKQWVLQDVHPPLYTFLMREWRSFFGDSEAAMRFPSAVLSVCLIATVPLFQKWMPVVRESLVLAAWFAASAGAIIYAQEARPYALLLLLSAIATLLSAAIAFRMDRHEPVLLPSCTLAGIVVIAEYSHYFGALMGTGLFGALIMFAAIWHRRYLAVIALPGVTAIGLLLPWLSFHSSHISDKFGGGFWITNDWLQTLPQAAKLAVGSPEVFVLLSVLTVGALVMYPRLLRQPGCFVSLVAFTLTLLGAMVISLNTPIITERNLLVVVPSYYLLVVTVLGEVFATGNNKPPVAGQLAAVAIVASSLGFAAYHRITDEKDQWREAAAQVTSLPGCQDARIQVYFWPKEIYAYYLPPPYRRNIHTVWIKQDSRRGDTLASVPAGRCPVIVWSGHLVGDYLIDRLAEQMGIDRERVMVLKTKGNMLLLDRARLPSRGWTQAFRRSLDDAPSAQ